MSFDNKRQYDRFPVSLEVTFMRDGEKVVARSKDISLGGMFIATDRAAPYGARIVIEVRLPALATPAIIEATVRWSGPTGMGLQWGALRARETWAINQLVKQS